MCVPVLDSYMEAKGDESGSIGQSSYKSCGCLDTADGGYVFLSTGDLGDRDCGRVTGNCSRSTGLPEFFKGRKLEHKKAGITGSCSEYCFLGSWVVIESNIGGVRYEKKIRHDDFRNGNYVSFVISGGARIC